MQRLSFLARIAVLAMLPFLALAERQPLGVIEFTSSNAISADLNRLGNLVNTPFIAMGLNAWMSKSFYCPNLSGVDVNKPLRLIVWFDTSNMDTPPLFTAVVPLLDQGETLRKALQGAYKKAAEQDHLLELSGVQPGNRVGKDMFAVFMDGLAVTGTDRQAVLLTADALKNKTLPGVAAISGTVKATLNIREITLLAEALFKKNDENARRQATPTPGMPDPAEMMAMQQTLLLTLLRQTESFSLGVSVDEAGVTLYSRTDPVAGSTHAAMQARKLPVPAPLRALLPANTFLAVAGTGLDAMDLIAEPYAEFMGSLYEKMDAPFSAMGPLYRKIILESRGIYQGGYALAIMPVPEKQTIAFVQLTAVKNEQAASRMLHASMTNSLSAMNVQGGDKIFTFELETPRHVDGTEILRSRVAFTLPDLPMPFRSTPFLGWLSGMHSESAVANGYLVSALGASNDVSRVMDDALARLKKGAAPQSAPRICKLFPEIAAEPVSEWLLSTSDILRFGMKVAGEKMAGVIDRLPPRGQGVGGIEILRDGACFGAMRISASELQALTRAFAVIQEAQRPAGAGATHREIVAPPHMTDDPVIPRPNPD